MAQYVERNESYPDGDGTSTNNEGRPVYVCDCCLNRRVFHRRSAVDAHEGYSSANTSASDMGIYPGLGEELSDYLPGRRHNLTGRW